MRSRRIASYVNTVSRRLAMSGMPAALALVVFLPLPCMAQGGENQTGERDPDIPYFLKHDPAAYKAVVPQNPAEYEVFEIDVSGLRREAAATGRVRVRFGEFDYDLVLVPNRMWESELEFFMLDESGSRKVDVPQPEPYKGTVSQDPTGYVRLTFDQGWVSGHVYADSMLYFIEPLSWDEEGARSGLHIAYRAKDIAGASEHLQESIEALDEVLPGGWPDDADREVNPGPEIPATIYADITPWGDYEFYMINPSNCGSRMVAVLNDVEGIFSTAIDVEFNIVNAGWWVSPTPLNSTSPGTLIYQVKTQILKGFYGRGQFLHLFSGKNLDGTSLGAAYTAGPGWCYGYSLSQQIAEGGYGATAYQKMIVAAHFIGYNFEAELSDAVINAGGCDIFCYLFNNCYSIMYGINTGAMSCRGNTFSAANITRMEAVDNLLVDGISPLCSAELNGGDTYTNSTNVTLDASCRDIFGGILSGADVYRTRNSGYAWSNWQCYSSALSTPWTLPSGDGVKRVYFQCRDRANNWSECYDDIILDTTPPSCSMVINGGATYTTSAGVTLNLSSTDATSGVNRMRFKNSGDVYSAWEPYATSKSWSLSGGDGTKTVYVQFEDGAGNTHTCFDSIVLDRIDPTCSIAVNGGATYALSTSVTLDLESTDGGSGVSHMRFKNSGGSWTGWEPYAVTKTWTLESGEGSKTVYVEFEDAAGNSHMCSDVITLDTEAPSCEISISAGAEYATSANVTLYLTSADGGSGVSEMRFKDEGGSWTGWQAYGTTKLWTLPGGDGSKTVYVEFKDNAGHTSQCTDNIFLDETDPSCSIEIDGGETYASSIEVTLSLSSTDGGSGVSEMRFRNLGGSFSSWEPYGTSKSWDLAGGDGTKTVYAEFKDAAGNTSDCNDTIILDDTDPTCSITINSGDASTADPEVTLDLSSTDGGSGISDMRFKDEGGSWTAWEPYATSKSWTLPGDDGTKTVYVEFNDVAGNTSQCSDDIELDRVVTCSILINGGDDYTASTAVMLDLSASSSSGVSEMRFKDEGDPWGEWEPYATGKSWILPGGDGTKTVYVEFKDNSANTSECSDAIVLDTVDPTCSMAINGGDEYAASLTVTLDLLSTDDGSGVSEMQFGYPGEPFGSWEPYATGRTWTFSGADGPKQLYVQFKDGAGHVSQCSDGIIVDTEPPTCSVGINDGAAYADTSAVMLTLSSADGGSGVGEMRFKDEGGTWSSWEAYATSKAWTLPAGDGAKTVYIEFKDNAGNVGGCSDSIDLDTTDPTCSIDINGGDAYAPAAGVTLDLSSSDAGSGVSEMRFKNEGGAWSGWEAYATGKTWTVPGGDGSKTVHVEFRDAAGNTSRCSDTIILETTAPTCSIEVNGGDEFVTSVGVTLDLLSTDAGSGVSEMRFKDQGGSWTDWEAYSESRSWTLPSGDGEKKVYVEFSDNAGNVSQCSDVVVLETTPPTCAIIINSDDPYTTSDQVTLILSAVDAASGVAEMRFRNEVTVWEEWEPYATSKSWTLKPVGDGPKAVYVEFRDWAGNVSQCSDDIELDSTEPTCSILINGGVDFATSLNAILNLSAGDVGSGVSEMRFKDEGGAWSEWEAYAATKTWTLPSGDGVKRVYVEFRDGAGNTSGCSDMIGLDTTDPTCAIQISSDSTYATSTQVMLTLSSSDAGSAVNEMRLKNEGGDWNAWETYVTTKAWTLPAGDGTKTVYAEFIDGAGNASQCSDSIILDTETPPAVTSLTACDVGIYETRLCWEWAGAMAAGAEISSAGPEYFDVRHSLTALDLLTWAATPRDTLLDASAGSGSFELTGVDQDTLYYAGVQAVDEAGNASSLAVVSFRTLRDTIPPTLTLGILQNPILTHQLDIYLLPSEPLNVDCILVKADDDTIAMSELDGPYEGYRGDYELTRSGPISICAGACDLLGNEADTCRTFSASHVLAAHGGVVGSVDGDMRLIIGAGVLESDAFVLVFTDPFSNQVNLNGRPAGKTGERGVPAGRSELTPAYTIGPAGMGLRAGAELRFRVDTVRSGELGGLAVFKWEGNGWLEVSAHWDPSSGEIVSFIDSFGTYQVQGSTSGVLPPGGCGIQISGPYPNPFAAETRIIFDMQRPGPFEVSVYDATGRLIRTLMQGRDYAGLSYVVTWNGLGADGTKAPTGVYLVKVRAGDMVETRRVVFIR